MTMRSLFTIALVAMVNTTQPVGINLSNSGCPQTGQNYTPDSQQEGEFSWDSHIQSQLLSSMFYGYVITQLPGGYLADKFGGARVFGSTVLISGVLTLCLPSLARWDYRMLMGGRFLIGLAQGPIFPANLAIWAKWAPELEKTQLVGVATSGAVAGTVVSMVTTGYLCDLPYLGGWPLAFYVFGGASCLWAVIWVIFAADIPSKCRWVSRQECLYIESQTSYLEEEKLKKLPTPWLSIATSKGIWAIFTFGLCDGLGYYVMFSCVPTYMKQVLGYDISQDGIVSALPFFFNFFSCFGTGFLSDYAVSRQTLSKTNVRKLFTLFGEGSMGVAMLIVALNDCNHILVVSMLVIGYMINGLCTGGANIVTLDMAPRYAGTLMGLGNTLNNVGGFLSPVIVDAITTPYSNRWTWQWVFFFASGIYLTGTIIFMLFGTAELQSWATTGLDPGTDADQDQESKDEESNSETQPLLQT